MKRCSRCGISKALTEFHKNKYGKDGLHSLCKNCRKQYQITNQKKLRKYKKQYRINNLEKEKEHSKNRYDAGTRFVESFKENCAICGFRDKPALVFHHRDPKEKKFTISSKKKTGLKTLQKEIAKCVVLCANCHQTFHYYDRNPSERPEFLLKKYLKLDLKISSKKTEVD